MQPRSTKNRTFTTDAYKVCLKKSKVIHAMQISALGRTVSLGDHDTEEEAAHAFDRAAINKAGRAAKTNYPMSAYENEITELTGKQWYTC